MKKLAILIILFFSLAVFAANEIQIAYEEGSTLYARVRESDGDVWNTSGTPAFENWADGNVTDYDIALTDEEGAHYQGAFPACSAGIYTVSVYLQDGANPAVDDLLAGTTDFVWDGSNEITLSMIDTNIDDIETDTAAVDTTSEMRTFLTGSDTTVATQAKQDTIDNYIDTEIAGIDANVTLILADTGELQTDWVDGGRLDLIIDTVRTDTNDVNTTVEALPTVPSAPVID